MEDPFLVMKAWCLNLKEASGIVMYFVFCHRLPIATSTRYGALINMKYVIFFNGTYTKRSHTARQDVQN